MNYDQQMTVHLMRIADSLEKLVEVMALPPAPEPDEYGLTTDTPEPQTLGTATAGFR